MVLWKENKYDFWEMQNIIYAHDGAIKFENQDLHDLFLETFFWMYLRSVKK